MVTQAAATLGTVLHGWIDQVAAGLGVLGGVLCAVTLAMGIGQRPLGLRAGAIACLGCALLELGLGLGGEAYGSRGTLIISLWGAALPLLAGAIGLAVARSWRTLLERDPLTPLGAALALACLVLGGVGLYHWLQPWVEPVEAAPSAVAPAPVATALAPVKKKSATAKRRKVVKLEPMAPSAPAPTATVPVPPPVIEAPPPPPPEPAPAPVAAAEPAAAPAPVEAAAPVEEPEEPDYREAVAAVVMSKRAQLRGCYEAELKKSPQLAGKVVVAFSITPEGRVGQLAVAEDTMAASGVGECIVALMRGWRFPFRPAQDLEIEYPFVFSPRK